METLAYGAASSAPQTEKFFTDPVHGVFAVVETFGADDGKLAAALIDGIAAVSPKEEQYFGLVQYRANSVLKEVAGKCAVSLAIAQCGDLAQVRWMRAGASGISFMGSQRILPVCLPRVWNPKSLVGEEYALPVDALGIGQENWEQGIAAFPPGEFLSLHTSGFPVFAPGLLSSLALLANDNLQATVQGFVDGSWRAPEPPLKGSTVVLVGGTQGISNLAVSF